MLNKNKKDNRKIDRVVIENFKSIRRADIELRDINILIGPNGVGKSNFINFFKMLNSFVERGLQNFVIREGGGDNILYFGSKESEYLFGDVYFQKNRYEFKLIPTMEDRLVFEYEKVYFSYENMWRYDIISENKEESGLRDASEKEGIMGGRSKSYYVYNAMSTWRVYHFHDSSPEAPARKFNNIEDNRFLKYNGANLSAFLYMLSRRYPAHFDIIEKSFKAVTPFFDRFIIEPDRINPQLVKLEWRHIDSDKHFNISHLSDGSFRLLCLLTLFYQPDEFLPSTIIIDEPELGLHPAAINLISEIIQKMSHKVQFIISTQSPQFISNFQPEHIIVADYDRRERSTIFKRYTEEDLEIWLRDYSLGEIWQKNILGGRP